MNGNIYLRMFVRTRLETTIVATTGTVVCVVLFLAGVVVLFLACF